MLDFPFDLYFKVNFGKVTFILWSNLINLPKCSLSVLGIWNMNTAHSEPKTSNMVTGTDLISILFQEQVEWTWN